MQRSIPSSVCARLRGPPGSFGARSWKNSATSRRCSGVAEARTDRRQEARDLARQAGDDRVVVGLDEIPGDLSARPPSAASRRGSRRPRASRWPGSERARGPPSPSPGPEKCPGRSGGGSRRGATSRLWRLRGIDRRARGRRGSPRPRGPAPRCRRGRPSGRRASAARAAGPPPAAPARCLPRRRSARGRSAAASCLRPRRPSPRNRGNGRALRTSSRRNGRSWGGGLPEPGASRTSAAILRVAATVCRCGRRRKPGDEREGVGHRHRPRRRQRVDVAENADELGSVSFVSATARSFPSRSPR